MRGPGRLAASSALGGVPRGGEPGSGEERGGAELPYVSMDNSKKGFWVTPGILRRGRGSCGSQSKLLGGFVRVGTTATTITNVLVRVESPY